MKLLRGNGKELIVREVGDNILVRYVAGSVPIKLNGIEILEDDAARDRVRELLSVGMRLKKDDEL